MGRLFWKFFFFIWLAQLSAIGTVSAVFWLERQQDMARWQALSDVPGAASTPSWNAPPAAGRPLLPPDGRFPPRPPPDGHPRPPLPLVPLLATLFASLVFAALLAWYFAKPIRSLRVAFAAAATGDLGPRLSATMGRRRDELADLGRDFDRMAGQLQLLMDGQRRLLHDVSHELRSPLARLQMAVGLARQQPEKLPEMLDRIERESVRIDHLVGELLTLSRLESAVGMATNDEVQLGEMLADVVADARFEAEGRPVRLILNADVVLCGNAALLQRALENVLRNAIRHTAPGAAVEVEAGLLADGRVRLAVLDAGPGVPETSLESIFQPFFRTDASASGAGYGLGLAIARCVIEAHGGSIAASNRATGGLCVEIILPVAAGRA